MSVPDYNYINELVLQAQSGDSNAFAELFAATSDDQYAFALRYLGDSFAAQEALQKTYVFLLKNLGKLREPSLMIAWLNRINMLNCMRLRYDREKAASPGADIPDPENARVTVGRHSFPVRSVMKLPFTQSQVLLLRRLCHMSARETADAVGIARGQVRRYHDDAVNALLALQGRKEDAK